MERKQGGLIPIGKALSGPQGTAARAGARLWPQPLGLVPSWPGCFCVVLLV